MLSFKRILLVTSNGRKLSQKGLGNFAAQRKIKDNENTKPKMPKLVIFDKDGTLICFHSMWVPWALEVSNRVCMRMNMDLSSAILQELGICPVRPGLLAEGTMDQINQVLTGLVVRSSGIESNQARSIVDQCTAGGDTATKNSIKTIGDIREMFEKLQQHNTKLAICTMDKRDNTVHTLEKLQLGKYIDYVFCCDDKGFVPKPHPDNAWKICKDLRIDPTDAIMVGDTKADINMALSAGLGSAVGVLSGVGCSDYLANANMLLDKATDLVDIFYGSAQQSC
ncbi:hypothetical protein WR25_16873 [Diploscapter pachys]|uniref:Uncharacterized protein n=1 Tax=Diploscapter pachys TaxID=2018661 RepID=A0A2A2LDZ0_9BILA|nr:hypothetical protein WR25_16873 [Diploscapter pachys]